MIASTALHRLSSENTSMSISTSTSAPPGDRMRITNNNFSIHPMTSKLLRSQELLNMSFTPTNPSLQDVLCGTGQDRSSHPGNDLFRRIASQYIDSYSNATSKKEKMRLTKCILDELNDAGVRFLKKHPVQMQWYVADQKVARDKIGHFLRDNLRKPALFPEDQLSSVTINPSPLLPSPIQSASSGYAMNGIDRLCAASEPSHQQEDSPLTRFLRQQHGNSEISTTKNNDRKQQQHLDSYCYSSIWNKRKAGELQNDHNHCKMEEEGKSFAFQPFQQQQQCHPQQQQPQQNIQAVDFKGYDRQGKMEEEKCSPGSQPFQNQQLLLQQQPQVQVQPPNMEIQAGIRDLILRSAPPIARNDAGANTSLSFGMHHAPSRNNSASERISSRSLARKRGSSSSCSSGGSTFGIKGFDLISPVMTSYNMDCDDEDDSDDDISLFDDTELAQRLD